MVLDSDIALIENEEMPIVEYIRFFIKYKFILILFIIAGCIFTFVYNRYKNVVYYQAQTTFFIPAGNDANANAAPSIANLMGVRSGSAAGGASGFMMMVIGSERLKNLIAHDFEGYFQSKDLDLIKSKLSLNELKIEANSNGIYSLIYQSNDPKIVLPVLESTFKNLSLLNLELDILAQRDFYKILDPATKALPLKEDRKKNYLMFVFGFFVAGTLFCLGIDFFIKNYKKIFD